MFDQRSKRAALLSALFAVAAAGLGACSGGATAGSAPLPSTSGSGTTGTGGSGTGGSGTGGAGSATASPSAGGSSSAAPSSAPTSAAGASSAPSAAASAVPTGATTPSSVDSINIVPAVLDGDLGGVAQIGILDPNYSGPYSVSVTGQGLLGNLLQSLSNTINGTLSGNGGGETTLTLNLANAVQLGLLGPSGDVVTICEQQNPSTCKSVSITNNSVVPQVGASLDSIVFGPNSSQVFSLIAPALSLTGFSVEAAPQGISVTNLGNGEYEASAAANIAVPLTGNITLTDGMGHTVTIPIAVL